MSGSRALPDTFEPDVRAHARSGSRLEVCVVVTNPAFAKQIRDVLPAARAPPPPKTPLQAHGPVTLPFSYLLTFPKLRISYP